MYIFIYIAVSKKAMKSNLGEPHAQTLDKWAKKNGKMSPGHEVWCKFGALEYCTNIDSISLLLFYANRPIQINTFFNKF